jgi:hypothetical protein
VVARMRMNGAPQWPLPSGCQHACFHACMRSVGAHHLPMPHFRRILAKAGRQVTAGLLTDEEIAAVRAMSWVELMASFRAMERAAPNSSGSGSSAYRGVCWDSCKRKWVANIGVPGFRQVNLGSFHDEMEAARAYDVAALYVFGR